MNFWNEAAGSYVSHTDLPFARGVSAGEQFETAVRVWSWQSHFLLCFRAARMAPRQHIEQSCMSLRNCVAVLYGLNWDCCSGLVIPVPRRLYEL